MNEAIGLAKITSIHFNAAVAFPADSKANLDKSVSKLVRILEELVDQIFWKIKLRYKKGKHIALNRISFAENRI